VGKFECPVLTGSKLDYNYSVTKSEL
jgi:hypothetical protein